MSELQNEHSNFNFTDNDRRLLSQVLEGILVSFDSLGEIVNVCKTNDELIFWIDVFLASILPW